MNGSLDTRKNLLVILLLGVFSLAAYSNSLSNPFLMDDHALVLENRKIGSMDHLQLNPFSHQSKDSDGFKYVYYRPITHLADYAFFLMFGKNVAGYHMLNLLLFFLCAVSLYYFFKKIEIPDTVSVIACLLFITHPINGVLINYTSTTGYILLILFTTFGFMNYLSYMDDKKIFHLSLSLLFFVLSLLCHETAIFFPIYLGAILYLVRKFSFSRSMASLIPFFVIISLYLCFRMYYASLKSGVIDNISGFNLSLQQYLAMYFTLILHYFKNLVFMSDIVLIYSIPTIHQHFLLWNIMFMAFISFVSYLIFYKWRNDTKSLALAWIMIGFGPVTLACFSRASMGMIISPHWLLISSIGYCLLIASLLEISCRPNKKVLFVISVAILLSSYTLISRQYNRIWSNEIKYCRYMLSLSPNIPLVKFWLGTAFLEKGDLNSAEYFFKKTIMNTKSDWQAYSNLGVIEALRGHEDLALQYYLKALERNPDSTDLLNNLAATYIEMKEYAKAEEYLRRILVVDPTFTEAQANWNVLKTLQENQVNN